jgi:hypothetical protein
VSGEWRAESGERRAESGERRLVGLPAAAAQQRWVAAASGSGERQHAASKADKRSRRGWREQRRRDASIKRRNKTRKTRLDKIRRTRRTSCYVRKKGKRKRKRGGRRLLIRIPSTLAKTTLSSKLRSALDPHSCPCIRISLPVLLPPVFPAQPTITVTVRGERASRELASGDVQCNCVR